MKNRQLLWYAIPVIILLTIIVDSNLPPDSWFPLSLFSIPFCVVLGLLGFFYSFLFKRKNGFNETRFLLIKISYWLTLAITFFLMASIIAFFFFDLKGTRQFFELPGQIFGKKVNTIIIFIAIQVFVLLLYFINRIFRTKEKVS